MKRNRVQPGVSYSSANGAHGSGYQAKNFRVRWFTDNQNVARILLVGSKKPLLHALAVKGFSLSVQNKKAFREAFERV